MRKELYERSFSPSSISLRNDLDLSVKSSKSCATFKQRLRITSLLEPLLLPMGLPRKAEVMLAQLRLGFSDLNAYLYVKGCINWGTSAETINLFFLEGSNYSNNRQILNDVSNTTPLPIYFYLETNICP